MNLDDIPDGDKLHHARLEIVEWKRKTKRVLYLCDERGFPLLSVDTRWHVGDRFFSAYLRSPFIRELSDRNEIGVGEMDAGLSGAVEEARQRIKDHFRSKTAAEAQAVVETWKAEKVYPYQEPPMTSVEQVEQEVFDIVATTAVRYLPDFATSASRSRAFQLSMMRTAIEGGSERLQFVMKEVLKLPRRQLDELAELIQATSLASIISANRMIANRLKFLTALEALIFDKEMANTLRERTQLHRLLADQTWIFGEEHHLMVDDRSLNECLYQHTLARNLKPTKGPAVKHPTQKRGIVDLMFGKQRTFHREGQLEHLVVELKAPTVSIGMKEVGQLEGYVGGITADSRFDTATTKWNFWALSRDVDESMMRVRQVQNAPPGVIINQDLLVVQVKTWAQVIAENRARMKFFQESLQITVTKEDALRHLKEGYANIFKNTPVEAAIDEAVAVDVAAD